LHSCMEGTFAHCRQLHAFIPTENFLLLGRFPSVWHGLSWYLSSSVELMCQAGAADQWPNPFLGRLIASLSLQLSLTSIHTLPLIKA
jgi:hypothetical protein